MIETPFGFETPQDSPGYLLWQTTMVWQKNIKKVLEPFGVTHAQFVLMAILKWWTLQGKPLTQVDLIRLSKLDKMTVSKSLRKLATLGLVTRSEGKVDARVKNVLLTPNGESLISELVPLVEKTDEIFFGRLKKEGVNSLIEHLQELQEDSHLGEY